MCADRSLDVRGSRPIYQGMHSVRLPVNDMIARKCQSIRYMHVRRQRKTLLEFISVRSQVLLKKGGFLNDVRIKKTNFGVSVRSTHV